MTKTNLSSQKAVILAGGKGTRLYPITREFPKPLLPVKRKPILNHLIDLFYSYGIKEIAVLINKEFREDFDWWKKRYYLPANSRQVPSITFFEEEKPLGTFGGLWFLKDWIGKNPFFFANGDDLTKVDLFAIQNFYQRIKVPAIIALVKVPNPQDYGVAICENGIIKEFLEKPKDPPSQYISSGLYLLTPEVFNYHPGPKFSMIETDLFPKLVQEKKLGGFQFEGEWMDCGTWERYKRAINEWR